MESFYYLWCGASRKEEGRHQFQEKGKSRWWIRLAIRHKKTCYLLVTRFLVVGKQSLFPRLC
jgi:hypothetical protein